MYVWLRKHAVEYFFLTTSSSTVFWMFRMEVVYRLKYSNVYIVVEDHNIKTNAVQLRV